MKIGVWGLGTPPAMRCGGWGSSSRFRVPGLGFGIQSAERDRTVPGGSFGVYASGFRVEVQHLGFAPGPAVVSQNSGEQGTLQPDSDTRNREGVRTAAE